MVSAAIVHPYLEDLYTDLRQQLEGEIDFTPAGVALYTSDASN